MSSSLPLDHLRLKIAPGAVLSADPDTWPWVDIPAYIHQMDEIVYTSGERDEAQSTLPSVVTLTLDNTDGRFSPRNPLGPWFGLLSRNTPLRLFWDTDPVSEIVFVSEWPPRWDMTAIQATAPISADGITRRLEQGSDALDSPLFRSLSTDPNVVAYWPCEDGDDSTSASSPIMGVSPWPIVGEFAAIDGPPGSKQLVRVEDGTSSTVARVPNHTPGEAYVAQVAWRMDEALGGGRTMLNVFTTSPDLAWWRINVSQTSFTVLARDANDTLVVNESEPVHPDLVGQWVRVELRLHDSGSGNVQWAANLFGVDTEQTVINSLSGTDSGAMGRIVRIGVGAGGIWGQERSFGHVAVLTGAFATVAHLLHEPFHGWTGERAAARFARLCDEEGLSATVIPSVTDGMLSPPGIANLATTPDHASLDITGDIDLRAVVLPDQWTTPTLSQFIVAKFHVDTDDRSYGLFINTDGLLGLAWSTDGTAGTRSDLLSTVRPRISPAGIGIRVTLDVNNGASGHDVTFYTADPVDLDSDLDGTWTQLGNVRTVAGATSVFSGDAPLEVGGLNSFFAGIIYAAQVRSGIGGTINANPDFTAEVVGTTSFDDSTGKTWTLVNDAEIARQDDSMPMGPQQIDTLIANLHDVAVTDGGRLTEHMGGFRYRTRTDLYNQTDALTLGNHGLLSEPPEPTDDDQQLRNDVTAQSPTGTSVRAVDQASVDQLGRYDTQLTVNPQTSDQLLQIANWALHLGTIDDMRWPRINLALHKDPVLIPAWLALRFGDRIRLDQTLSQLPGIEVDQLIIGAVQRFTRFTWDVTLNCVPALPFTAFTIEDDPLGRIDTSGSETSGSFDAGTDTSLTVVTTAERPWINSTDHASEFPFHIKISGVVLNVTAITGSTSPQTFTVDAASVNGVEKTIASGSAVHIHPAPALAL